MVPGIDMDRAVEESDDNHRSRHPDTGRPAWVYTLNLRSRANPMSVIADLEASATASDEGAPTATTRPIPAAAAFWRLGVC